jgi:predicted ATP-dependent serine protease
MSKAIPYNRVQIIDRETVKFGDDTFDEFISDKGGVERGTMIALAGTSGAGKTTLCKKLQRDLHQGEKSVFYALESRKSSVARQTARIKTGVDELICDVDDFNKWSSFMSYIKEEKPLLVIVDSLQHAAELLSKENGKYKYDNYKNIIRDLYEWKDETDGISLLIVQMNAKNEIEGPASTIFDVDVPIFLIADPKTGERTLTTEKNRMGKIGTLNYEFTSTEECIKFYTQDEWKAIKQNSNIFDFVGEAIERYTQAYKNQEMYPKFKKELSKEYNKIYSADPTDGLGITIKVITLIDKLANKYFL